MATTLDSLKAGNPGESGVALSTTYKLVCVGLLRPLMSLVMIVTVCGCQAVPTNEVQEITPQILLTIERGTSQKRLEALLGVPAKHEFTASRDQNVYRCVSYQFVSFHLKYYFVFTNSALEKIIQPPRFEHELSSAEHGKRAVWKSYDPEERMEVVLQATDLDQQGIMASIEHRYGPNTFDNALPGAIIAGVIGAPVALARGAVENREIKALAEQFDPYRVRFGMTVTEVEGIFGSPILSENSDDSSETHYYGSPKLGAQNPLLWVSIVFENGKVIQVFSDDFFNYRKIEKMVKEGK